jgi:hypothetical protein
MEDLNSGYYGTSRFKVLESKHWADYFLYEPMVLFNYIIEVLNLSVLSSAGEITAINKFIDHDFISVVFVCGNNSGNLIMNGTQSFLEEFVSRLFITIFRNPKIDGISFRIDSSVEITPFTFDLDVGLIGTPGVIGWMKIFPYSFINNR